MFAKTVNNILSSGMAIISFGEKLLQELDPERGILSADQHQHILAVTNGNEIARLLEIDLADSMNPDLQHAYDVFSQLESRKIAIPRLMMCLNFYTIAQCMLCIEDNHLLVKDKKLTSADRISAHKCCVEAVTRLKQLVEQTRKMADGYMEEKQAEQKPVRKAASGVAPSLD